MTFAVDWALKINYLSICLDRPDMTFAVDWALKINCLSIYLDRPDMNFAVDWVLKTMINLSIHNFDMIRSHKKGVLSRWGRYVLQAKIVLNMLCIEGVYIAPSRKERHHYVLHLTPTLYN